MKREKNFKVNELTHWLESGIYWVYPGISYFDIQFKIMLISNFIVL